MSTQQPNQQQSTAMVTGPKARLELIKKELEKFAGPLTSMMPEHMRRHPDKMLRIVISACSRTPDLLECTPSSIVLATAQACACGIEPNTPLKLGYLVPFRNKKAGGRKEAQFIPGYAGLIRLAIQSGEVQKICARVVHKRDDFQIRYGTDDSIHHVPFLDGDAGPVIGAYAVAELKNGAKQFEFMTLGQLNAIKAKAASDGAWITDEEEMQRKTPIRRLAKFLPLSEEKFAKAIEHEDHASGGEGPDFSDFAGIIDVDPETGEVKTSVESDGNGGAKEKPSRGEALQGKLDGVTK